MKQDGKREDNKVREPVSTEREVFLRELNTLPGNKILDRLLEMENPRETVHTLSSGDFYWLVKKIGDEDCVPLLNLASTDQWQYLIDLEIWKRDRVDMALSWDWMKRLQQADFGRLIKWLLSEGEAFTYYHLFRSVELIVIGDDDEVYTLPEGFFSLDGNIYIRVLDSDHHETIESIIREISRKDFIMIFFTMYSLIFLLLMQIGMELNVSTSYGLDYNNWQLIFYGLIIGVILSVYKIDKLRNPLDFIRKVLIFSFVSYFVQITLIGFTLYLVFSIFSMETHRLGLVVDEVSGLAGRLRDPGMAAIRENDLGIISLPYLGLGVVVLTILIIVLLTKIPATSEQYKMGLKESFKKLLANRRYLSGVVAQAFYVGAQIMCWTYIYQYVDHLNAGLPESEQVTATWYNMAAMGMFLTGRWIGTALMKYLYPPLLMMLFGLAGVVCLTTVILVQGMVGLYALVFTSTFMSIMFPTIYGIALKDMGDEAKIGSAGLVMAIVGGSFGPVGFGQILDMGGSGLADTKILGFIPEVSFAFILPLICLAVVACYGYSAVKAKE